ncbi:MAG: hypothetical protein NT067_05760 [Candidatus Diapherotrites archaeon]|nr:hypothetical protein [Candidatus Diapherotrites archaeon]
MKTGMIGKNTGLILVAMAALFCVALAWIFLPNLHAPTQNPSGNPAMTPDVNTPIAAEPSVTPEYRITQAKAMQQIYDDFYGPPLSDNGLEYFAHLVDLDWNSSSFHQVISDSMDLALAKMEPPNSGRVQPVLLNIGVSGTQKLELAATLFYRQDGQYGVIIELHLERNPVGVTALNAGITPVYFWSNDYDYPVAHEMRHVKRFVEAGIFDDSLADENIDSAPLYQKYLVKLMNDYNFPADFNSALAADQLEELAVVLETDNPKEIALNIDRLNLFTIGILKNDESLGVQKIAPLYLMQIVLARHLSEAYAKPRVQKSNYSIRASAFDEMNVFSTSFRNELYNAYPENAETMQSLEAIYEEAAKQAIKENSE